MKEASITYSRSVLTKEDKRLNEAIDFWKEAFNGEVEVKEVKGRIYIKKKEQ